MAPGITDLHSHLVPGVDDGAETVDGALEALRAMVSEGVVRMVTTPHLDAHLAHDGGALEARLDEVDAALQALRGAMAGRGGELPELLRGHEVALDDPEPVFDDPRTRLAGTDFVLVEWPYMHLPPGSTSVEVLERIRGQGWIPVVAHPERYKGIREHYPIVEAWRRAGAVLQANHGSLLGVYGRHPQANVLQMLEDGMVDLLSSDYHGWLGRPPGVSEVADWFAERGRDDVFELLTRVNPERLLDGELPSPVPPLGVREAESEARGFLGRLRRRIMGPSTGDDE